MITISNLGDFNILGDDLCKSFLHQLSPKKQSKISTTSKWINLQVCQIHRQHALKVCEQENIFYDNTLSIEIIRNRIFNFYRCFKHLPNCMQEKLKIYRIQFINEGKLTKGTYVWEGVLTVVTLKALRPAKKGICWEGFILVPNYQAHCNESKSIFKDGKLIQLKEDAQIDVPERFQSLFDTLDKSDLLNNDEEDKIFSRIANRMNVDIDHIVNKPCDDNLLKTFP